jgi:hypothetical protein
VLEERAFILVVTLSEGIVGGAHREKGADFRKGGRNIMTKKVMFPAWWFLPIISERSPPK